MAKDEKAAGRIKYWIDLADYDSKTAAAMLKTKRYLYVGFMCHQVIEKALKACYVRNRNAVPPPLNVESRYPTYKAGIFRSLTHRRCQAILSKTRIFFKWLKSQL